MNNLIFAQAARFILPMEHLFQEVTQANESEAAEQRSVILAFYTAQLFCRLLMYTLSSEQRLVNYNWVWHSEWTVRACAKTYGVGKRLRRKSLGLDRSIQSSGMLWITRDSFDWLGGHVTILKDLYIPRSPVQSRLASQRNVLSFGVTRLTIEPLLQQWLEESRIQLDAGNSQQSMATGNRRNRAILPQTNAREDTVLLGSVPGPQRATSTFRSISPRN